MHPRALMLLSNLAAATDNMNGPQQKRPSVLWQESNVYREMFALCAVCLSSGGSVAL